MADGRSPTKTIRHLVGHLISGSHRVHNIRLLYYNTIHDVLFAHRELIETQTKNSFLESRRSANFMAHDRQVQCFFFRFKNFVRKDW